MATKTHLSKITERPLHTVTGTLCNRMSNAGDDLNVTTNTDEVTCKFCLRILTAKAKGAARAAFQPETVGAA